MSVISKETEGFNHPTICDQCNSPAVMWWMLHLRITKRVLKAEWQKGFEDKTIVDIGLCAMHAQDLVLGMQRDLNELVVGKKAADKMHLEACEAISARGR